MEYRSVEPIARHDAERNLTTGDEDTICETLLSIAFFEDDFDWAEDVCIRFTGHDSPNVRQIAITCLGHLARIHKRLSLIRVRPILKRLLNDRAVAGTVQETIDDIETFIGSDDSGKN